MAPLAYQAPPVNIAMSELVTLAAMDSELYARVFFPKTVRQTSPPFHREMDAVLDSDARLVAFMIFRDGAKTTKVRLFISKRIAYGISRTIVVVGKSQDHARRTIEWLMRAVEFNSTWVQTFGLRKGTKWTSEEIEIFHGIDEVPIRVIALGITGSTRGINVDDYRPDLIVVDDPCDEENTATPEQREKTDDFINGSLRNSLAPVSENPLAKMVFMQTTLHVEDSIQRCMRDSSWSSLTFSVFNEHGESRWPSRWDTQTLQREKESFTARGKLHLWMREKECCITSDATSVFPVDGLQYYDILPDPDEMTYYVAVDPVPPPSDKEVATGLRTKDWEVWSVIGKWKKRLYLLETRKSRGHSPDWSVAQLFEILETYPRINLLAVESINYQRTLKWYLETALKRRGRWIRTSDTGNDRRKKVNRIIDSIGDAVGRRILFVHPSQLGFIEQYRLYPNVKNDDEIESVAMAINAALNDGVIFEGDYLKMLEDEEKNIPELEFRGACP